MGIDKKLSHLALTAQAANFANIVAPSVGMSGIAVFISEARRKGISSESDRGAGALYCVGLYRLARSISFGFDRTHPAFDADYPRNNARDIPGFNYRRSATCYSRA